MSGLAGLWNLDGRIAQRELLARMSAALQHRGLDGEGLWCDGAAALACQLLRVTPESLHETQPLAGLAGIVVVFDGRLDDREALFSRLPSTAGVSPGSPDAAFVLAAYAAFGEQFAERLAGDFALVLFDPARQRLYLVRDALGVRPLYYHYRPGRLFVFASEIKALLAHPEIPARPNALDVADFLLADSALHERGLTFFEDVHSVPPAHVVTVTPEGLRLRQYWDFNGRRTTRLRTPEEYAEAFRERFQAAVRRRLRSAYPIAFSVSGGLDSSSVFCMAHHLGKSNPGRVPPLAGFTFACPEGAPSDELMYILEIEQACRVKIERVPVGRGMLEGDAENLESVRALAYCVEGPFLDEQWSATRRLFQAMRRRGARLLLTGHWGDQFLFSQAYLMDLLHGLRWGTVLQHLREYRRWMVDTDPRHFRRRFLLDLVRYHVPNSWLPHLRRIRALLCGTRRDFPWYSRRLRALARRPARFQMAPPGGFLTAHAQALYQDARARYYVLSLEWDNKVASMFGMEMAFPFLDRDLISFLMSIPGEVQTRAGVPKAILRDGMRGLVPEAILSRRWKADFLHLILEGMQRDYQHLVQWLGSDGLAVGFGYVEREVMQERLARLQHLLHDGTDAAATRIMEILGLSVWLQAFFGENATPKQVTKYVNASA